MKFKINNGWKIIVLFVFFLNLLNYTLFAQSSKIKCNQKRALIKTTNSLTKQENKFVTKIRLENKVFTVITRFKNNHEKEQTKAFYMNDYIGTSIVNGTDTNNFIPSLSKESCKTNSSLFPALFQGDSIDNRDGFTYRKVVLDNEEYYILTGYYLGCNGSFCNNASVLIIRIKSTKEIKYYRFGLNRQVVNLSKLVFNNEGKKLQLIFPTYSAEKVKITVRETNLLLNNESKKETGIFCVQ